MDLSGVAAVLALLSIPVTVLVSRWQMRTTLVQSEANYRAALEVAEANHRAALEVADASHQHALETAEANHQKALELAAAGHRSALEVARRQAEAEHLRWIAEARTAEYRLLENTLTQFRRLALANEVDRNALSDIDHELHQICYSIQQLGTDEVYRVATHIHGAFRAFSAFHVSDTHSERETWWRGSITPLRAKLSEAVKRVLDGSLGQT
ncbi:hypothetical protein [Streptomyces sp. NBC_01353]|uniref:hypothetical protein n=1 Tax=Streptomyces sp. NBC_01353 TaxID=2903835 RepID=UPI002E32D6DF|nr:hypothetical protein [Streptomyces sp. NBC_01353]